MNVYSGIGKVVFFPISDNAKAIPPHHILIEKNDNGLEFIDVETGLVATSFTGDLADGIHQLASLIVLHAEKNISSFGMEHYLNLCGSEESKHLRGVYEELKKKYNSSRKENGLLESSSQVSSHFTAKTKFSFRNVA